MIHRWRCGCHTRCSPRSELARVPSPIRHQQDIEILVLPHQLKLRRPRVGPRAHASEGIAGLADRPRDTGWQAPLLDEVAEAQVGATYEGTDALLLGRRTYDIFAAYWPYQEGGEDNEIATLFNREPKHSPAASPTSRGSGPRSSARTWLARCARSVTGTCT
jgi:hypothetical protein